MSLSTSPLPALPTEVWERAIDWLVIGYTSAGNTYIIDINLRHDLSSCALVCSAWRIRAQAHLFAFLRISGDGLSQYETMILRSPILCKFAKEFSFLNQYTESSKSKIKDETVETASHAVRIAHKLFNLRYLLVFRVNLAIEHSNLPRHIAALTSLDRLDIITHTPTKLSQLARILVGLKNLTILSLNIPILVEPIPSPLPSRCYATKSFLTKLVLDIQPGGHLLPDWLVQTKSFTTSLQTLTVRLDDTIPKSDLALVMQGAQALLDSCTETLREWTFWARVQVDEFSSIPNGTVT